MGYSAGDLNGENSTMAIVRVFLSLLLIAGCASPPGTPALSDLQNSKDESGIFKASAEQKTAGFAGIRVEPVAEAKSFKLPPAEDFYGLWVMEEGNNKTWLRLESPRIHVVRINLATNAIWVADGHYSLARNGMTFGVVTSLDSATVAKEQAQALFDGDERLLPRIQKPGENKMLPFCGEIRLDGEEMVVNNLRGSCFADMKDFHGRFKKVSLTRPTYARPPLPLGMWELNPRGMKVRTELHLGSKQLDLTILDQVAGQRIRLSGDYDLASGGLLYGLLTTVDFATGIAREPGPIVPQAFCFRYGVYPNMLAIREIAGDCFAEKAQEEIKGEYNRIGQAMPGRARAGKAGTR
jgi:hypothetical protein